VTEVNELAQVRGFNRIVAESIGALGDHFLGRGRPMGESRVLWEIGPHGCDVRELRSRLALDSGYLSRVLQSLERQHLITVQFAAADRRVRHVALTELGHAECAELDRRSDAVAQAVLEPLNRSQREQLVTAMRLVERLLAVSMVRIEVEDPRTADARWCIGQYFEELNKRFDVGFDPARSISATERELRPPSGLLLVARLRGQPIGCGALKLHGHDPAELKRMWLAPQARGLKLGRRMLQELEHRARVAGVTTVRLETNRSLVEAIGLYRASGYREVAAFNDEPYADHWFEKTINS
jgi:DNA-binding MarR family transcriptional regulator/ribosomal protein S18 acetylase RimI-like enzyme